MSLEEKRMSKIKEESIVIILSEEQKQKWWRRKEQFQRHVGHIRLNVYTMII